MRIISVGGVSVWKVNLDVLKNKKKKRGGLKKPGLVEIRSEEE